VTSGSCAIGAAFGARFLLEGSIANQEVPFGSAPSLSTTTGTNLWAETYDRNLARYFRATGRLTRTSNATGVAATTIARMPSPAAPRVANHQPPPVATTAAQSCAVRSARPAYARDVPGAPHPSAGPWTR
jgi:hypothetical protein